MEFALIGAEDVRENSVQPEEKTIEELAKEEETTIKEESESQLREDLKEVLEDIHDLALGGIDVHGFKSYAYVHPNQDYEVTYFVKGTDVIMVDYHGTNTLNVEVLGKKEAGVFLDTIKEAFGIEELNSC